MKHCFIHPSSLILHPCFASFIPLIRRRVNRPFGAYSMIRIAIATLSTCIVVGVASAQTKSYESPNKKLRALIVTVGLRRSDASGSRVEIRSNAGTVMRRKSFAPANHNPGQGVGRAEWTADSRLFVFNSQWSGGHQPWHCFTYVYSVRRNRFFNLDATVGAITSEFTLRGHTLVTTRLAPEGGRDVPVTIRLSKWR